MIESVGSIFSPFLNNQLIEPDCYKAASPGFKKKICNGCGTSGWKGAIVPETMYGLIITPACQVHDWMYHFGKTAIDKVIADIVFLLNLITLITQYGGYLMGFRLYRAMSYYLAVSQGGNDAFWSGKTRAD